MIKLVKLLFLCALPILLNSCIKDEVAANLSKYKEIDEAAIERLNTDQNLGLVKDVSGVYFKKTTEVPDGRTMSEKFLVGIVYTLKTFDGREIIKATAEDSALVNFYTSQAFEGFFYSLLLLKEGEKGIFYIPSTLAYQDQPLAGLTAWQPIILEMEVPRIYSETEQLDEYYRKRAIVPDTITTDGVRANFLTVVPEGAPGANAKIVTVAYKGSYLSGITFDSGASFDVSMGTSSVIKGFENGIKLLRVGEKGNFTFTSDQGYGDQGSGTSIPPYTPLNFEIELISISQ